MRTGLLLTLLLVTVSPALAEAQASRDWITETTLALGHRRNAYQSFVSDGVAVGDLGVRWSYPTGMGLGISAVSGFEFMNEAFIIGGRARVFRELTIGRLESSAALLVSSIDKPRPIGGVLGFALYPHRWGAVVVQVDLMPTRPPPDAETYPYDDNGELIEGYRSYDRATEVSFGLRATDRAGVVSWIGAGAVAVVAIVANAVLPDCFGCLS